MKNNAAIKVSFGVPEQKGNVTIYPALPTEVLKAVRGRKTKVAAYVRVSTDSAQQEGSLILQREYFEHQIKNNSEYEFVGIYEDDGVTATSVEKRKGFLKMMEDCKEGKIDLILTKSISRFARNTGDLLHYINMLNSLNPPVEIRFEADRVSTFGTSGETFITFFGLFAQEESRAKSESITWAVDNRFAQGKFYVPAVYGYTKDKGRDKPLVINEEEAKIVRLCYAMAIDGYSLPDIANTLNKLDAKGRRGKASWKQNGIASLLSNEKYAGDLRARKTVTPNYKTHKVKKNEGEKPQYYVKENHEPIVPPLAHSVTLKIIKNRRGSTGGIPYLKAVTKGALKGFIAVNKAVRGYTLSDYVEVFRSVCKKEGNSEISIFADKTSMFDLRTYDTVSIVLFEDNKKPSCSIKNGKFTFNAACRKALMAEKAELLFHPTKAIIAIRTPVGKKGFHSEVITKPIHLSHFAPIALESAGLKSEYQYRIHGTKRTKNGESVMFFDLRNAKIISEEKDDYILPNKYAERYGDGYYENLATDYLHKIDIEKLWQALQKSKPADSLAGQIVELTEFSRKNLAEFGLLK
jgi:DNA invertase Pin-like site-specific DNA recombinase